MSTEMMIYPSIAMFALSFFCILMLAVRATTQSAKVKSGSVISGLITKANNRRVCICFPGMCRIILRCRPCSFHCCNFL